MVVVVVALLVLSEAAVDGGGGQWFGGPFDEVTGPKQCHTRPHPIEESATARGVLREETPSQSRGVLGREGSSSKEPAAQNSVFGATQNLVFGATQNPFFCEANFSVFGVAQNSDFAFHKKSRVQ